MVQPFLGKSKCIKAKIEPQCQTHYKEPNIDYGHDPNLYRRNRKSLDCDDPDCQCKHLPHYVDLAKKRNINSYLIDFMWLSAIL